MLRRCHVIALLAVATLMLLILMPPEQTPPNAPYLRDLWVKGHARPHPELCPSLGKNLRLLVLVTSAPHHTDERNAIRQTWGQYHARSDVAIAFMLGTPPSNLIPMLRMEDALYKDLIISNSVDSYNNLTLKTLAILEWKDTYCPQAPRLLKTDDDVFINVGRLLCWMKGPLRINASRTIWGHVLRNSRPERTGDAKYFVPHSQYARSVFPHFAIGAAYLLTADSVRPLLAAAPSTRFLRLEDVFVTGVLASKVGLTLRDEPEFSNSKMANDPCTLRLGFAVHDQPMIDLWRKLHDNTTNCNDIPGEDKSMGIIYPQKTKSEHSKTIDDSISSTKDFNSSMEETQMTNIVRGDGDSLYMNLLSLERKKAEQSLIHDDGSFLSKGVISSVEETKTGQSKRHADSFPLFMTLNFSEEYSKY